MSGVFLRERCLGRIYAGHPWVYASDIQTVDKVVDDGGEVVVRTPSGGFIGTGFYNSKSRIPVRIYSRTKGEKLDESFFRRRLTGADALRKRIGMSCEAMRMVWSEADFLPGVVIDRYGDSWVLQTLTLATDQRKEMIASLMEEVFGAKVIVERNDVASREFEGLHQQKGVLRGRADPGMVMKLGRARMHITLLGSQKTGEYLDQIPNHVAVGALSGGKRVLDCFCYHGGFALHASLGGAVSVDAMDISQDAVETAGRNAELNNAAGIQWKVANVFDELKSMQRDGRTYDLIVLDPPSFTKTRSKLNDALRGYKEINLRALKMLGTGGLLATFCCSHHVDGETFRNVVLDAAFDARRLLRWKMTFAQGPDHPVIPAIPETEYLKGYLFEVVSD